MSWNTMAATLARWGRRSMIAFSLGDWGCAWLSGDVAPERPMHHASDDCVQCLIDRGLLEPVG